MQEGKLEVPLDELKQSMRKQQLFAWTHADCKLPQMSQKSKHNTCVYIR